MNVRITVLKTELYKDIADEYLSEGSLAGSCPILKEGDSFLYRSDEEAVMPKGLCPWAWIDLYPDIAKMSIARAARKPGQEYWYKYADKSISCCRDGVRPVVFLLERIEDEA